MVTDRKSNINVLHFPIQALSRRNQTKTGVRTPTGPPPFDLDPPKSIGSIIIPISKLTLNDNTLHRYDRALSRGNDSKVGVQTFTQGHPKQ